MNKNTLHVRGLIKNFMALSSKMKRVRQLNHSDAIKCFQIENMYISWKICASKHMNIKTNRKNQRVTEIKHGNDFNV